jgi:DNA-3-methyladenine glycosylase
MFIAADEFIVTDEQVATSARIGVNYAAEDALLPYRFYLKGNKYVSGRPNR